MKQFSVKRHHGPKIAQKWITTGQQEQTMKNLGHCQEPGQEQPLKYGQRLPKAFFHILGQQLALAAYRCAALMEIAG